MTVAIRHHLSPVLALALLATLLVASAGSQAAESSYDNVERVDVSNYTAAGIAVSKRVFPDGADAVVLTRDDHFPDALAASALAAKVGGPVLFTATASLTSSTATELDRILDASDTVYITGGDAAVSENVANQIRARGYAVHRLNGATRIETAVDIAGFVKAPASGHVLLARAYGPDGADRVTGWVDSVTCGGYANHAQTPVLLTQTANLDQATATALDTLGAKKVTICGGDAAVSDNVAQQLRDAGLTVERVSGATRIETAIDAAKKLFGATSADGRDYVLVTGYGENFGWGLAATPLAGALGAPILLVAPDQPTSCTVESQSARATLCYLETVGSGKADLVVVGSAAQVGDAVRDAAAKAAGGKTTTSPSTDPDGPLATPTSVTTSNVSTPSEGRVTVSWAAVSDPDDRLEGYNVYYGPSSPDTKAGSSTPTVGPNATSFTVSALQLDSSYTFAVTSVTTDAKESAKSSAVTQKTIAPSVDLTSPSASSPARVEPSSGLTVDFDYAASEGGSFQLFHRVAGSDTWTAFPETPNANPATVAASDGTTRSVNVTTPGAEGTYDLRIVLRPMGTDAVEDVETGALDVNDLVVQILEPTETLKAEVLPETTGVDVVFEYAIDSPGTYVVSLQPNGSQPEAWTSVAEGSAPAGEHEITEQITAPTDEDAYDVRVQLDTGSAEPDTHIQRGALHVVTPAVELIAFPAGDGTEPAIQPLLVAPGGDVSAQFDTNASGHWKAQHRPAGATDGWVTFTGTKAEGNAAVGGAAPVLGPLVAPGTVGSHDVSVEFTPNATGTPIRTADEDGAALLNVATAAVTDPTSDSGSRARVGPGEDVEVTIELSVPVDVTYQIEARPNGTTAWEPRGEPGTADATSTAPIDFTVPAPTAPGNYDLRVLVAPADGTGSVADVQIDSLVVEEGSSAVTLESPTNGAPAQVAGDGSFDVVFRSDIVGGYVIECSGGSQGDCGGPDRTGRIETAQTGEAITVLVTAPAQDPDAHGGNTYDVTVTVTPDDGSPPESPMATSALRVGSTDITDYPAADGGDGTVTGESFPVTFVSNVDRAATYELFHRNDTEETGWEDAGADGDVSSRDTGIHEDVSTPQNTTENDHTYSLKVEVRFDDDGGTPITVEDIQTEAFVVPGGDGGSDATVTEPTVTPDEAIEDAGTPLTVQFTATYTGDYATYKLSHRGEGESGWTDFDEGTGLVPQSDQETAAGVRAPEATGDYDIRVEIFVDPPLGEPTPTPADAVGESLGALTVIPAPEPDATPPPTVDFDGPRPGDDPTQPITTGYNTPEPCEGFSVTVTNNGTVTMADAVVTFTARYLVGVSAHGEVKFEYWDDGAYQDVGMTVASDAWQGSLPARDFPPEGTTIDLRVFIADGSDGTGWPVEVITTVEGTSAVDQEQVVEDLDNPATCP